MKRLELITVHTLVYIKCATMTYVIAGSAAAQVFSVSLLVSIFVAAYLWLCLQSVTETGGCAASAAPDGQRGAERRHPLTGPADCVLPCLGYYDNPVHWLGAEAMSHGTAQAGWVWCAVMMPCAAPVETVWLP